MSIIVELSEILAQEGSPVALSDRKACVEFTLASLLAVRLPIPSSPVDSVSEYYATNCKPVVEAKICPFNEEYPINLIDVQNSTFALWRRRYDFVHPSGCYTNIRLYSVLPEDLAAQLPPNHIKMANNEACFNISGTISLALEGK